ncbi:hypothetical protein [Burkholderia mayonis]|uniref:VRR-NUC domain-containing protein n=1 Tax=Burkholderia mayonis TaxID=1385591 RepID=A0A1B4G129_9BURK|nr:hypothetical protein [Burkholderia mayonis]AOJ09631.1 hypothetical protein WS71_20155 [Burkholderia mayonis]KVE52252.1 hypothetical protein WS71_09980 [Burkholderia mayonis]
MTAPSLAAAFGDAPRRRAKKPRAQPEFDSQVALFEWARMPNVVRSLPGLDLLEGSMNGVKLTAAQAGKAKAAGMLKGSHDVRLPVARGRWIGLSIELKAGKGMPTDEQLAIGTRLEAEGWRVHFIWDWLEAVRIITEYLSLPRPDVTPCSSQSDCA